MPIAPNTAKARHGRAQASAFLSVGKCPLTRPRDQKSTPSLPKLQAPYTPLLVAWITLPTTCWDFWGKQPLTFFSPVAQSFAD
jgi:hypothetical protein